MLASAARGLAPGRGIVDPSYNLAWIAIKRRTANPWVKRGTLYRKPLDVLRTATAPMTGADIARPCWRPTTSRTRDSKGVQTLGSAHTGQLPESRRRRRAAGWRGGPASGD
jgi:hypothetical protein